MFNRLRQNGSFRFALITALLTSVSLAGALVSAVATQAGDVRLARLASRFALIVAGCIVLYVIPKLAQSVRMEHLRADFSFPLTGVGKIFIALITIVVMTALSTGNNLLYLVLAVLLATGLVSAFAARANLSRLKVALRFPDHIFAGEPTPFDLTVENRKWLLPAFSLAVVPVAAAVDEAPLAVPVYLAMIPPRAAARARVERNFAWRGVYAVSGFVVQTRFPFGFFERRHFIEANGEVVVYPQPRPLAEFGQFLPPAQGQRESVRRGGAGDLYAIRPYLRSDHRRYIDWKATARTTQLMVDEFTRDDDWRVTVIFAAAAARLTPPAAGFSEKYERAITLAASLLDHYLGAGAEVRLLIEQDDSGFGGSRKHLHALLRRLARLKTMPETRLDTMPETRLNTGRDDRSADEQRAEPSDEDSPVSLSLAADHFSILITPASRDALSARVGLATHIISFDDL